MTISEILNAYKEFKITYYIDTITETEINNIENNINEKEVK